MTLNPKIQKYRDELAKNKARIAHLKEKNKELESQIQEMENIDIIGLVRTQGLTLEQFAELLHKATADAPDESSDGTEESPYYET